MAKKKQVRRKHSPQRTCIICRQTNDKRQLTRLVRTTEDGVQIDLTGKQNGRGAYLCDNPVCWQKASETDQLERALRTTLTTEDRDRIRAAMPVE